jgi:membrane-associated phospholipid phosphatase
MTAHEHAAGNTRLEPDAPGGRWTPQLRATDAVILVSLALYTLLALAFAGSVEGWAALVAKNAGMGALVLVSAAVAPRIARPVPRFVVRMATIAACLGYLFEAVAPLQLVLHGRWLDDAVVSLEQAVFGAQPTVWLERWITPWLTEWLMFCYVSYLPLYPVLCAIARIRRGEAALEDVFLALGLAHAACNFGFILYPVAGPLSHMPGAYSVPLDGWIFTSLGESLRSNLLYPGGSIPSPHAAAATVMLYMAWKYHRPTAWVVTPVILGLYVSTFYCRYHYLTDAVVGIAAAVAAASLAPAAQRAWDRLSAAPWAAWCRRA